MSRRDWLKYLGFTQTPFTMSNKKCTCKTPNTDLAGRCFKCGEQIEIPVTNNTNPELPAEVAQTIKEQAEDYANTHINGRIQPEIWEIAFKANEAGATSYAIKLVEVQQERDQYRKALEEIARGVYYPQGVARGALLSPDQILDNSKDQPAHY